MNDRYILPVILISLLWLWAGCTRVEPVPTAVSQSTPTATILPTITAQPATATFTPTPLPTLTTTPLPTVTSTPLPTPAAPGPTATPIRVSDKVGFELLAQVGGQINSFAVTGDLILVGQGPRLVVLDGSDPANLTPIGQSDPLPGLVSNLMVREDTASTEPAEVAVLTAGSLLMVWDVSDPTQPAMVHSLTLPAAGMLLWQDDIIYAAGLIASQYVEQDGRSSQYYESYVATIDVSGPPRLLDQITLPYNIQAVALVGDILYLASGDHWPDMHGVLGLEASNPAQLGDLISIPLAADVVFSLQTYGETLLVGGSYELAAFDVSDPRQPVRLWREEGAEIAQVYDFAVRDEQVHTLGWQAAGAFIPAQAVIDLPQPLPDPVALSPAGRQIRSQVGVGLLVIDDHLYRLLGVSLDIIDLAGAEQTVVGSYTPPVGGHLAIMNETIYVGLETGYVDSYRLADLAPVDQTSLPQPAIYSLTGDNGRLYLTGADALYIYDSADLTLLGQFDGEEDGRSFLFQQVWRHLTLPVVDNIAYAFAQSPTSGREMILRLDVNNPAQPEEMDSILLDRNLRIEALAANERWLAVSLSAFDTAEQDHSLIIYEQANGALTERRTIPLPLAPTTLWLQDDLLLAGGGGTFRDDGFLQLYQMPEGIPLTSRRMPGVYDAVMAENNLALVTTQTDRRLLVFDFTDPVLPQAVGAFDLPFHRGRLAVSGDYMVVADQMMGLYLLRLER